MHLSKPQISYNIGSPLTFNKKLLLHLVARILARIRQVVVNLLGHASKLVLVHPL